MSNYEDKFQVLDNYYTERNYKGKEGAKENRQIIVKIVGKEPSSLKERKI